MKATNPILKGFNPDPSMIRVGDDYYIATSTFEWFPGVRIHHSKDLKNWHLLNSALTRTNQLDMLGAPDSCGVWAPCLSYADGIFYLVYSNVRSFDGGWKDTPNFLVTTTDIEKGEWSDPIFMDSSGFDASLFHDDDGRKWYTSMLVDHRGGKFFGGIILQEYDNEQKRLVGKRKNIFSGSSLGITEAPHIYKRNGYYYLVTAEGGTEYNHSVSVARSRTIDGEYELHPQNPIISAKDDKTNRLQKAGHASFVELADGQWYGALLVSRPLTEHGRCPLGRETALVKIKWENDWMYHDADDKTLLDELALPSVQESPWPADIMSDTFDSKELNPQFNSLRIPITEELCSLQARDGYLRIYGCESLSSYHKQSLLARRVEDFAFEALTTVEFEPQNFQQMAGLVLYYNTMHYHYLHISYHEELDQKRLQIITCDKGQNSEPVLSPIVLRANEPVRLKVVVNMDRAQFFYTQGDAEWQEVGGELDFSILSDDYVCNDNGRYKAAFTGAFVGLCCQDLTGHTKHADFDDFSYIVKN